MTKDHGKVRPEPHKQKGVFEIMQCTRPRSNNDGRKKNITEVYISCVKPERT